MHPVAEELSQVTDDLFFWQAYDPKVKADLFSTAFLTSSGILIVDPIPLAEAALNELVRIAPAVGIVITNANHVRVSHELSNRFSAPLFAHRDSLPDGKVSFTSLADGDKICDVLDVIELSGAAPGEIALHFAPNDGTLVVGDALINFEPLGFSLLPKKYCSDEKEMRRSLRKLLLRKSERMFFAHGTPILSGTTARLHRLLNVDLRRNPS
jgi:glyoxylase-like metal-dependent hydrolase (beta-lactamase superfamily II)